MGEGRVVKLSGVGPAMVLGSGDGDMIGMSGGKTCVFN